MSLAHQTITMGTNALSNQMWSHYIVYIFLVYERTQVYKINAFDTWHVFRALRKTTFAQLVLIYWIN